MPRTIARISDECERNDQHDVSSMLLTRPALTCSNMSIGRCTPDAARRSAHFGRMPVARKRPRTRPSGADAGALEQEDVLHRDDFALHAGDLRDAGDLARAVRHAARPARSG